LDTIAQPNDKPGVRSKRNSNSSRTLPKEQSPRAPDAGAPVNGSSPERGGVADLVEALARSEQQRVRAAELLEQAEEDLSTAHQRLTDADAARRHLLDNVASGGDEARRRFASVLHDDVLQQLTGAELQLERISADAASTRYAAPLADLKRTMKTIEDSLRNLLYNVSPAAQDAHVNLGDAIRDRLLVLKQHTGIEPDLDIRLPKRLPPTLRSIVFRNISEAVTNVEKHANATRVSVKAISGDGGIQVEIADDGTGFVVSESLYLPGHLGLVAMRERAQLAGGWCRFESEPGTGTRVTFWVPSSV
jgi:signal transduction histidine kinase